MSKRTPAQRQARCEEIKKYRAQRNQQRSPQAAPSSDTAPSRKDTGTGPPLCYEQLQLLGLALTGANIFYTGGAGTGKSTVLRAIVRELQAHEKQVYVVTPTRICALGVSGTTYSIYAGWTPSVVKKPIAEIENMAIFKQRRQRMLSTDVLIIDGISMLEANQFRRLDRACQAARKNRAPFGGIQVIITGDFYQLPPVLPFGTCFECAFEIKPRVFCTSSEMSKQDEAEGYQSQRSRSLSRKNCFQCGIALPIRIGCRECGDSFEIDDQWAFGSDTWAACQFRYVALQEIHRQSDHEFIDILNTFRIGGRLNKDQLTLLSEQKGTYTVGQAMEILPIRKDVEQKNSNGLKALPGDVRVYRSHDYTFIQNYHPHLLSEAEVDDDGVRKGCKNHRFPQELHMKHGMPVVLLANINQADGLVNGSQGRVVGFIAS